MSLSADRSIVAVLLIGGRGERFWPRSRRGTPKQFLAITSPRPMLADTIARVHPIAHRLIAVTAKDCEPAATEFLRAEADLPPIEMVVEPARRSTAPALGLAAIRCRENDVLAVLPSDHFIPDADSFRRALAAGAELAARKDGIVCFGLEPNRPETGYGYIRVGEPDGEGFRIASFVEKPPLALARRLVEDGALWNGGIFVVRAGVYLELVRQFLPAVHEVLEEIRATTDLAAYERAEYISVDHGILEKAETAYVVRAAFRWDDVGDWGAMSRIYPPDEHDNATRGDFVGLGSRRVVADTDQGLIAAIGIEDVVIVRSGDIVLVARRGEEQKVRDLLHSLDGSALSKYL